MFGDLWGFRGGAHRRMPFPLTDLPALTPLFLGAFYIGYFEVSNCVKTVLVRS